MEFTNIYAEFLVSAGLYDSIRITEDSFKDFIALVEGKCKLDVFCKECGERRVFSMEPMVFSEGGENFSLSSLLNGIQNSPRFIETDETGKQRTKNWKWNTEMTERYTRLMEFRFHCSLDNSHHLDFVVSTNNESMMKIGQYPSVADISFPELKSYEKVMDKETAREFRRAIGLHAQGIGVGSYVYLRRIFERILEEAKKMEIDNNPFFDQEIYEKAKVKEKIQLLKPQLPGDLVNNSVFYGIVSKGIHELSENQCIEYFPVLKQCLFRILRQWDEKRKDQEEQSEIRAGLARIESALKG